MKTIKITTPENIEVEYTLAALGSRTAATGIDTLLQLVLIGIVVLIVAFMGLTPAEIYEEYKSWAIAISLILIFIINYGYFIIFEMTMNGGTPGKRIFGLRTIRNNGQPIAFKHSVIRNLLRILDVYGLGVILIFFTKLNKRLGDYLASTIVVIEEKREEIYNIRLENERTNYKYSLTQEETQLLREYFTRKDSLGEKASEIERELGEYFIEKYKIEVIGNSYNSLLVELFNGIK
ncbi:RDD domain-containing protein [Proteiniborus sp. DW1]|uniref:RDD family protein n=1 Tax=Proteiniborus sp. DW1 TaxID=1889883 RepID=UPI00092DFE76|nr:RDD family protein [Proteiniborus sp. DW1]SCG84155.1 RDD domain-containing protein [Proteiniborus sp. DW1]